MQYKYQQLESLYNYDDVASPGQRISKLIDVVD